MTTAIPLQIREMIVKSYENGLGTQSHIAAIFNTTQRTVGKFLQKYRNGEDLNVKPQPGRPAKISAENMVIVKQLILSNPDKTLAEYCILLDKKLGIKIKKSSMGVICLKLNLRRKKRVFMQRNKIDLM